MDFDAIKDRRGKHANKWDGMQQYTGVPADDDAIAMWVADMDFDAAPAILDELRANLDDGFLGYFGDYGPVHQAICNWMKDQHGWTVQPDWIRFTHGVVAAFAMVLEEFSDPGDPVVLFTPVYHAFFGKAKKLNRGVLESRLVLRDGRYEMDLDALAGQLTGREKIVVLCSPHNPGGRLWSAEELRALAAFCVERDLILISDEIHMDLVFPGNRHIPTAVAAPEATPKLITITAASKGFNTAGGETGFAIIEDKALRDRFDKAHAAMGGTPNRFGMLMTKAAFAGGGEWSRDVRAYLAQNFALWRDRIDAIPGLSVMDMPSTYLSWVDFSGTGMGVEETTRRIKEDARIAVNAGSSFGAGGETWHRFNIAMPRARLELAIQRMEAAFADLQ